MEGRTSPYEVYGLSSIKSFADLKKRTVRIGGIKDITRIYLERMLGPNGLKPGDYDLVFAGATAARFSALASGSIDATILNAPFNFKAQGLGLTRLGAAPDYVRDFPFTGYSVGTAWAKTHKAELAGFLDAYRRGVDWFYDPANRTEAVDIMQKLLKVDRSDIDQTWAFYIELKVFDREGRVAASGIENLLKSLKDYGDIEGSTDVARFVNADVLPK
jgi:ABC-type nitrate/sulfonate/bicarbonate transport system substrate-binding protein